MGKAFNQNQLRGQSGLRIMAALALTVALATVGCTTNRYPGTGEPMNNAPSGGSVVPSSTPGSSGGTAIPMTMVSASVDKSVDAIAVLRANEGFRGKVLGPANPAPSPVTNETMLINTGQVIPAYVNPQTTVNSSISSPPNQVISSGLEGLATTAGTTGITPTSAAATITPAGTTTGLSSTTASALTTRAAATRSRVTASTTGVPVRVQVIPTGVTLTNVNTTP